MGKSNQGVRRKGGQLGRIQSFLKVYLLFERAADFLVEEIQDVVRNTCRRDDAEPCRRFEARVAQFRKSRHVGLQRKRGDVFVVPAWRPHQYQALKRSHLFRVTDEPLPERLHGLRVEGNEVPVNTSRSDK